MDGAIRALVRRRAGDRCEYCGLPQSATPFRTFHVDHMVPRKHGGGDEPSNLALACDRCSLHKGSNLSGIDSQTGQIVPLFNPRTQAWKDHFRLQGARIVRLTPGGRATVRVCHMNAPPRLRLRIQTPEPPGDFTRDSGSPGGRRG